MPADQYPPDDPRRPWAHEGAPPAPSGAPADAPRQAPPPGWNAPSQDQPSAWGAPSQAPPSWGAAQAPPKPSGPPPASWSTPSSAAGAWASYSQQESGAAANLALAVMGGFAGAVVAGLIWWGIVATTRMQIVYLAFGVGWIVAQGVLICAQQRNRIPLQLVAGTFTLLALGVSEYFIQRSLFIADGGSLPLWNGLEFAIDVVREGMKDDPATGFFWIIGVIVAVVVAGRSDAITRGR